MVVRQQAYGITPEGTNELTRGHRYRQGICVLLGSSLLLQTLALVAPGWDVYSYSKDGSNVKSGVFYYINCDQDSCKTIGQIKRFFELMDEADYTSDKLNIEYRFLDVYIPSLVGLLLAWILTFVSALIVGCTLKRKALAHIWLVVTVMEAVSVIIMGNIIYGYLVHIDITVRRYRHSVIYKDYQLHFPYCLFFFAIACLLEFVAAVLMFKCHYDEVAVPRQREPPVQYVNSVIHETDLNDTEYEIQTEND